jgi:hypothetical protein
MAMLSQQPALFHSLGITSGALPTTRDYGSGTTTTTLNTRTPMSGTTLNGTFASPTESEFSDGLEESNPVR